MSLLHARDTEPMSLDCGWWCGRDGVSGGCFKSQNLDFRG